MSFIPQKTGHARPPTNNKKRGRPAKRTASAFGASIDLQYSQLLRSQPDYAIEGVTPDGKPSLSLYRWNGSHWQYVHPEVAKSQCLAWLEQHHPEKYSANQADACIAAAVGQMDTAKAVAENDDEGRHFHIEGTIQALDETLSECCFSLGAIEADIEHANQIKVMVASIEAAAPRGLAVHIGSMQHSTVQIDYTLDSGEEIRRVFTCPANGGEISEIRHDGKLVPAYAYLTDGGARATCETQAALPQALHTELLGTIDDDRISIDGQSLDYDYGLAL